MKVSTCVFTLASALLLAGCHTAPIGFHPSSVPVPQSGYTVVGAEVTGESDQIWVLGFGGNNSVSQQARAYREALSKALNADGLVGMSIDVSRTTIFPFFVMETTRVTGMPVKFNK